MADTHLKREVHHLSDKLTSVLGYLELGESEKAMATARAAIALLGGLSLEIEARTKLALAEAAEVQRMSLELSIRIGRVAGEVEDLQHTCHQIIQTHAPNADVT